MPPLDTGPANPAHTTNKAIVAVRRKTTSRLAYRTFASLIRYPTNTTAVDTQNNVMSIHHTTSVGVVVTNILQSTKRLVQENLSALVDARDIRLEIRRTTRVVILAVWITRQN